MAVSSSATDTARRGAGQKNTSTGSSKVAASSSRTPAKSPLANIEFQSASDIIKYAELLKKISRTQQLELHTAADELQAVLVNSTGSVFDRVAARRKARKIAAHLRRAADDSRGMAIEAVKLQRGFRREYAELIDPPKKPKGKTINWTG